VTRRWQVGRVPTSVRTPPPSSQLISAPTPPRLLGLRPVLAGLAVLAVGVPAVLALPGTGTRGRVHPTVVVSASRPPSPSPAEPVPVERGTLSVTPRPHKAGRPRHTRSASAAPPPAKSAKPRSTPVKSAPAKSPAWVRAECARRYPAHDPRRAACVAMLTSAFGR
jgi:hypothetical protein